MPAKSWEQSPEKAQQVNCGFDSSPSSASDLKVFTGLNLKEGGEFQGLIVTTERDWCFQDLL